MGVLVVQYAERHPTDQTKVRVTFNEAPNAADVVVAANYSIDNGVTVSAAAQTAGSALKVDLTVSALSKSVAYKLTIINVRDAAGGTPIISPNNEIVFIWLGVADNNLNGVPEFGGLLFHAQPLRIGDQPLGYNVITAPVSPPPTITNVLPAAGTAITPTTVLSFDVLDDEGNLRLVMVIADFPILGIREVVHDGMDFGPSYRVPGNQRTELEFGFHYEIVRKSGWPASPTLVPYAVDTSGSENA